VIPPEPQKIHVKPEDLDTKEKEWIRSVIIQNWEEIIWPFNSFDVALMELEGAIIEIYETDVKKIKEFISNGWEPGDADINASISVVMIRLPIDTIAIKIMPVDVPKNKKEYIRIREYAKVIDKVREMKRELERCRKELEEQREPEEDDPL